MAANDLLQVEYNKLLQCALRELTQTNLVIDGVIGKKSLSCFKAFGASIGYIFEKEPTSIDGELGEAVYSLGKARYATSQDYTALAGRLSVPESYIRAVAEVETRDHAFLVNGKTTILFERHKFNLYMAQALKDKNGLEHARRVLAMPEANAAEIMNVLRKRHPDICSAKSGGYLGGMSEYNRLEKARMYSQEAAFKSASWGRFQIMGFNHELAGYKTATDMVFMYEYSEKNQLDSLATFIISQPDMHRALKARDFAKFASLYNGKAYAENKYDIKMDQAEIKWAKALAA